VGTRLTAASTGSLWTESPFEVGRLGWLEVDEGPTVGTRLTAASTGSLWTRGGVERRASNRSPS